MHYEIITLDRVFDIQRRRATKYKTNKTEFSFECNGKSRYALNAEGWPNLRQGDRLILAMRNPGNTQTLVGWKNISTGETVTPNTTFPIIRSIANAFIFMVIMLNISLASSPAGRVAAWCFCGGLFLALANNIYSCIQGFKDSSAIRTSGIEDASSEQAH